MLLFLFDIEFVLELVGIEFDVFGNVCVLFVLNLLYDMLLVCSCSIVCVMLFVWLFGVCGELLFVIVNLDVVYVIVWEVVCECLWFCVG